MLEELCTYFLNKGYEGYLIGNCLVLYLLPGRESFIRFNEIEPFTFIGLNQINQVKHITKNRGWLNVSLSNPNLFKEITEFVNR